MDTKELERQLRVITPYLTKEEAEKVLPLYKKYYKKEFSEIGLKKETHPSRLLSEAFHWRMTEEGHDFWEQLNSKITERYNSLHNLKTQLI